MKVQADLATFCAGSAFVATPSDSAAQAGVGLIFNGGACAVVTAKGETVVIPAAFADIIHPLAIAKVLDTGTDATAVLVYT